MRRYFSEYIEYICNNDVTDIVKTLKQFINRGMAKKNNRKNIYDVIPNALEYYHKYVKPSIKDSTKRQNESLLSEFRRFLDTLPSKDRTMQIFSQKGLNRYKQYLIDKMERSKTDDKMRNFGVGQLNRCGSIIALLINRVLVEKEDDINPVVWNKVDDPRREDQIGHIPLLDKEVSAIENCSGLTDVEDEYRNLFLLQLECGQRVSDMAKILTGKYNVEQGKKYRYIVLSTIKENIKAYVPLTPRMTMLLERVKAHELVDPKDFEEKTKGKGNNTYNEAIRRIAKKADLDREIVKINASQTEVRKLLYETITSHDARCTFITNMIKKGVSPDRLCKMTGHASDEMIKRVYAQLSDADEINRIESDIFSDIDEDNAGLPVTKPNESVAVVPTEIVEAKPKIKNVQDFDVSESFDQESYIKGLEDTVNNTLTECEQLLKIYNNPLLGLLRSEYEEMYNEVKTGLNKKNPDTDERVIKLLNRLNDGIDSELEKYPDDEKRAFSTYKYCAVLAFMDYCKEKRLGGAVIESLEEYCRELCEENSMYFFSLVFMLQGKVLIPVFYMLYVCASVMSYVLINRPYVDDGLFDNRESIITINRIPDLKLVLNALHVLPPLKLQALINVTDCPYDIKADLYNSIVSEDFFLFSNTIKEYERETYKLITTAYSINMYSKILRLRKQSMKNDGGRLNPQDMLNKLQNMLFQIPIKGMPNLFNSGAFINDLGFNIKDLGNTFDVKGMSIKLLDLNFKKFNELKKRANSSEIKVFNNVLKQIDRFPDVKKAYYEYKNEQKAILDSTIVHEDNEYNAGRNKPNVSFDNLEIFKSEINFNDTNFKELLPSLNSEMKKLGDELFKEFINYLAHSSCIDDDDLIKQLLVYRFTGACRPEGGLKKIPWNPDKLNELAYVIRYATVRGANGKYEKVRDFFEGPTFPDNISMIRTTADNAPLDFRLKLNSLYPDVFTIKGAR